MKCGKCGQEFEIDYSQRYMGWKIVKGEPELQKVETCKPCFLQATIPVRERP